MIPDTDPKEMILGCGGEIIFCLRAVAPTYELITWLELPRACERA